MHRGLRQEIINNPAAMKIIALRDRNLCIRFKAHLDDKDQAELKKNARILAHYRQHYSELWERVGYFLHGQYQGKAEKTTGD